MRDTEANACRSEACTSEAYSPKAWIVPNSSRGLKRAVRLAIVALGIGLVLTAGVARAADDEVTLHARVLNRLDQELRIARGEMNGTNHGVVAREQLDQTRLVEYIAVQIQAPLMGELRFHNNSYANRI